MNDIEGKAEGALAEIAVCHREFARRQPSRQGNPQAPKLEPVAGTAKRQRLVLDRDAERHRDAEADIFFQPGRAGKTFGGMDHLRKAALARADAGPGLAAASGVFGHRDYDGDAGIAPGRQRTADQAHGLGEPPADVAEADLIDHTDADDTVD